MRASCCHPHYVRQDPTTNARAQIAQHQSWSVGKLAKYVSSQHVFPATVQPIWNVTAQCVCESLPRLWQTEPETIGCNRSSCLWKLPLGMAITKIVIRLINHIYVHGFPILLSWLRTCLIMCLSVLFVYYFSQPLWHLDPRLGCARMCANLACCRRHRFQGGGGWVWGGSNPPSQTPN